MADQIDVQAAQVRLLELRARAAERLASLRATVADVVAATAGANVDDEHDPEGATIGFERAQAAALAERALATIEDADAALERLRRGTYGVCERCGEPIPPARLEARPTARLCVSCS